VIFATAGHVDHGKTTLIKALTGKNTDQLAEEQRRGLTIDLGFAWLHDSEVGTLGFVDVPGHARFIRTMLAGLAGVDAALLVVAADEGPMPQTREHLALLDLMGIQRGIVVMTAIDRASKEQQTACQTAISILLRDTSLSGASVIAVDAISGQGMAALVTAIKQLVAITPQRSATGTPRFLIDRRFTVPGAGCVVTGTLIHGQLNLNDPVPLSLAPTRNSVRLRDIQIDGHSVSSLTSGQRAALNLSGTVDDKHPQRGDWLLAAEQFQVSERLDVQLRVLPYQTVHRGTLQILTGASAVSGRLVWLEQSAGLAQLLLDKAVHAIAGDPVIVREPAANQTLAGGQVLDPQGRQRGRRQPLALTRLRALAGASSAEAALSVELAHQAEVDLPAFARRRNLTTAELDQLLAGLPVIKMGDMALDKHRLATTRSLILACVEASHKAQPEQLGIAQHSLMRTAATGLSTATELGIIRQLVNDGSLRRHATILALPHHQPVLPPQLQTLWPRIQAALSQSGLRPPIVGELGEQLGLERAEMLEVMQRLQAWGYVMAVAPNRFYLPEQIDDLAALTQVLCNNSPDGGFVAAEYRDLSGIGRNLTIKVLEYLDRSGVTYYRGERRFMQSAWRTTQ
jgi:selenocysteine-specific elongation factor